MSRRSFDRICVLVLDGLGVGALPDAQNFGDASAHTLKSVSQGLRVPTLERLGLLETGNLNRGLKQSSAFFTKMTESSAGKDTTTGHWEMMGLPLFKAFDYFPQGFPKTVVDEFLKRTKLGGILANRPASGTQIIEDWGEEHIRTGFPIVYTSADSVFQVACHEEHFGLSRLYEICEIARELLNQELPDGSRFNVGRVIARPFVGETPKFYRTKNRKDYSVKPPGVTALSELKNAGIRVIGIGKIPSIFDHEGLTDEWMARDDDEGVQETQRALREVREPALIFSNLNDLDTLYGHRRNVEGYRNQLQHIDERLESLMQDLNENDLLVITADHGNDPGFRGTDHTREYVPLLMWSPRFVEKSIKASQLHTRSSFADLGQSIVSNFNLSPLQYGKSFWSEMEAANGST